MGEKERKLKKMLILKDDLNLQIVLSLLINNEMSMTELSKKLNKSKATIHRHINELMQVGFIQLLREEKVRGSIKAKHFSLTDELNSIINLKNKYNLFEEDKEKIENYISHILIHAKVIQYVLDKLNNFISSFDFSSDLDFQIILKEIITIEPSIDFVFLTEQQFKQLNDKMREIFQLLGTFQTQTQKLKNIITLKPYFYASILTNIANVLKFRK